MIYTCIVEKIFRKMNKQDWTKHAQNDMIKKMKSEFFVHSPPLKLADSIAFSNLHNKYAGGLWNVYKLRLPEQFKTTFQR